MTAILDKVAVEVIKKFGKYTAVLRGEYLAEKAMDDWMKDPQNVEYMKLAEPDICLRTDFNYSRVAALDSTHFVVLSNTG